MDLKTFQQENAELWSAVQEWIRDGWGVGDEIEISPLMVAAALEKEAVTQDSCVAARDSDASYPIRLRQLASQLARTASIELGQAVERTIRQLGDTDEDNQTSLDRNDWLGPGPKSPLRRVCRWRKRSCNHQRRA